MPVRKIAEFSVQFLQVMDEAGNTDDKLLPALKPAEVRRMYELMVLSRVFDDKALALQRQGRIGTYAPVRGQEACQVGSVLALSPDDWIFPAFRETAATLARNVPPEMIFQYWGGDERGSRTPANLFPPAVPVATQIPHTVGAAWAFQLQGKKTLSLVYFGDGATSRGDFHEGMNFAGVFKIPCIFLCQNNQWAISVPVAKQTAAETLAQKAVAYGMPGIRVDGNDVFAVYKAVQDAADRARSGKGPTLIECLTYRMGDHTTSDDAKRYRTDAEVAAWKQKDPILRLQQYLLAQKLLSPNEDRDIQQRAEQTVAKAVEDYENEPLPNGEDMFRFVYQDMTPQLREQHDQLKTLVGDLTGKKKGE